MTDYALHLNRAGETRTLTITGDTDTPDQLAAEVHRHARGQLGGSRVDVQLDGNAGTITSHGAVAGTFTLKPVDQPEPAAVDTSAPDHVAHGYTMRDIHRAARCACAADRTLVSDITTRYDIAWSAIAEHLIGSPQPPTWDNLVRVGWQAIYRDVKAVRRLYGVDSSGRSGDVASAPRFVAYWTHIATDSIGEGITERIAVHQVLGALPESQREAVVALATLDDYQKGADALGINYKAMVARLGEARRRFRRHWYAPETAPPIKGTDRRIGSHSRGVPTHCPQGHEYTPENTIFRPSRPRSRICRTCSTARDAAKYAKRKAAA